MPPLTRKPSKGPRPVELESLRYQAILDTARDAIISIDRNGIVTDYNKAAVTMFGYTAEQVVGRNVSMLMPAPYDREHDGYIRTYQRTGVKKAIGRIRDVEAKRKDGEIFPIELAVSEASIGDEVLYTAIIRDVSALRHAREEVRRLESKAEERARLADIGAITTKLVHDLGNPLSGISMQTELLQRKAMRADTPVEALHQPIERILAGVSRLRDLVRGFTDFAREQRLTLTSIDVTRFLANVVDHWRPEASARGVEIGLDVAPGVDTLTGDEVKLQRVLDNLVKNAVESLEGRAGTVRIDARATGSGMIAISVSDDGAGIPDGVEVFRLFETTKPMGTGIGLPVSKEIVQAHGGTITYRANVPRGTVLHVELPIAGPAA